MKTRTTLEGFVIVLAISLLSFYAGHQLGERLGQKIYYKAIDDCIVISEAHCAKIYDHTAALEKENERLYGDLNSCQKHLKEIRNKNW